MPDPTDENRIHVLELPVEIQLEILRQLIEFQSDHAPIANTRLLKGLRLSVPSIHFATNEQN